MATLFWTGRLISQFQFRKRENRGTMIKVKANMNIGQLGKQNIQAYQKINLQGKGNYGHVYMGRHKQTNQIVAIKKVEKKIEEQQGLSVTFLREISILKKLDHPNIVKLLDYSVNVDNKNAYLVMEFMTTDLDKFVEEKGRMSLEATRYILRQILEAINYCHNKYIIHRDLKPSNILFDPKNNHIKIADFGIAKTVLLNPRCNTSKVAALYYRSPQNLLENQKATFSIDMWGIGCIFAECLLGYPLFKAQFVSQMSQLMKILTILQIQTNQPLNTSNLQKIKKNLQSPQQLPIENKLPFLKQYAGQIALDLLNKMLIFNPSKRITVAEALKHQFFNVSTQTKMEQQNQDLF